MNKTELGKDVLKQFQTLKAEREPLNTSYRDSYAYTYPSLGVGFLNDSNDGITNANHAAQLQAKLFDSTATDGVRLLSSSVLSSLTPPNNRWFDLAQPMLDDEDLDQSGKEWLEDSAERIHTMIHASNYDTEALEFCMHQMIAGMAGIYVELKKNKFYFETWPLNHLYCQEVLKEGYIDTVYRQFNYTTQQAVVEFGLEALPQSMKDTHAQNEHDPKTYTFIVAIRPRIKNGVQASGKTSKQLPWESLWVAEDGTVVKESGFNEMPVIVPRWLKIPDTAYARGPVFDALPDIKTLNKVKENMLLNMDMHITGMYKVKDDGVVNPSTIKFGARRIIPVGDMDNLVPLQTGGDIQFAMNEVSSLQGSIRRMLLADQLGPTEKSVQTATEVQTRNNQVRQILGPIFARLQSEYLTHLIERCFGLVARADLLPPPPVSITQGKGSFEIVYRSPLARSQKMQELQAIDEYTSRIQPIAQIKPEVLDFINFDKMVLEFGDLLGIDPELLNDEKAVKQIRYLRNKKQEQANQQAQQQQMVETATKAPTTQTNPAANLALAQ